MLADRVLIVLGMFDTTRPDRARSVRIHNMTAALAGLTPTELISGDRPARRGRVWRLLLSGGLRRTRAIYVEASTSTATESDLLLLTLAQRAGIPIIVYIPDAYQYFPDLYPRRGIKTALLDWGWRRSIATYLRVADVLAFPSAGLSARFTTRQKVVILPPGGKHNAQLANSDWDRPTVFYVGGASFRYGSDMLIEAMQRVVEHVPTARCRFVTSQFAYLADHPLRHAPWLIVEHRSFDELPTLMTAAAIAVSPLRRTEYNDLAMAVKLFDFMSYGLPVVSTDCTEMAALVKEVDAGLVVEDNVDALAVGILRLLQDRDLATRLGRNGYQAIQSEHSWQHRGQEVLRLVEEIEHERVHL